jgi:YD repeat-containing protein
MKRKRWFRVIAIACFLVLLGAAGTWFFLHRMVETAHYIEPHAPGTYYFAMFRGGVLGPFQPQDEVSKEEALTRDIYVIGTYDDQGRLIAIEKWFGGEQEFRYEYSYDAEGRVEERGLQEGGQVIIRRFPWTSI